MKTIADVCKSHRTTRYFTDPDFPTMIGVFNHGGRVMWYDKTEAGYSLCGSEDALRGSETEHTCQEEMNRRVENLRKFIDSGEPVT